MGDVLTVTKPEKCQHRRLRQDLLVISQNLKITPPPSDNQKSHASRPAGRQEDTAASDDLTEGWKHGEVWVSGRPESPPLNVGRGQKMKKMRSSVNKLQDHVSNKCNGTLYDGYYLFQL
ncbi:hypothetical protein PAMP_004841 [Pampus punctatissimus]